MKVLHIWDADYPWDIRVEKISKALRDGGHEVHIVARNRNKKEEYSFQEGLHIHRMKVRSYLNGPKGFPVFINPYWISHIRRCVRDVMPALIIVRDLPLAAAAMKIGRGSGIPVIYDMAECYPEMLRNLWQFGGRRRFDFLIRSPYLASLVEGYVVRRVDHIFAMIKESQQRLHDLGVPSDRISIVSNTPVLDRFNDHYTARRKKEASTDSLSLVYIGNLDYSRGLDTAVRGFAKFLNQSEESKFHIYGDGRAKPMLEALVTELNVGSHVNLHGWVDNSNLPRMMEMADVGIVPHYRCGHWDHTIPNKLFDYMAAGCPVIVSDSPPTERIVHETQCGLTYSSRDPDDLSRVLVDMLDQKMRGGMAVKGRHAVESRYNWDRDKVQLLNIAESLAIE